MGGAIFGGDSFFEYSGSYEQDGDRLTATVRTRRVCDGPPTVFGIDEMVLKLEGRRPQPLAAGRAGVLFYLVIEIALSAA
jgi:hypothetical protein